MSTKAELLKRIEDLEAELRERDKIVAAVTKKEAMEIQLPWAKYHAHDGGAPNLSHKPGLGQRLIEILQPALLKHGARLRAPTAKDLNMHQPDSHSSRGDIRVVVPTIWGEVMVEIVDCAAQFGKECYAAGYEKGSYLLGQLSEGKITADQFDESLDREKAIKCQERRTLQHRIRTNEHDE